MLPEGSGWSLIVCDKSTLLQLLVSTKNAVRNINWYKVIQGKSMSDASDFSGSVIDNIVSWPNKNSCKFIEKNIFRACESS